MRLFCRAFFAGIAIGLGGCAYVGAGGLGGAVLFSVGLFAVCEFQLSLFTGKCGYLGIHGESAPLSLLGMLAANLLGASLMGVLYYAGIGASDKIQAMAQAKLSLPLIRVFLRAIPCGLLMFIAVHAYKTSAQPVGKYLGIVLAVPAFIMANLEHCVADAFYFGFYAAQTGTLPIAMLPFTALAALGNMLGSLLICTLLRVGLDAQAAARAGCAQAPHTDA